MHARHKRVFFLAVVLGLIALFFGFNQYFNAAYAMPPGGVIHGGGDLNDDEAKVIEDLVTRPDPPGTPTVINVGLYVLDIGDIDDVKQTFEASFAVRADWKDPRLATGKKGVVRRYAFDDVWNPHPLIFNRRDLEGVFDDHVIVDDVGNVVYTQRLHGNLGFHLDMKDFPMDEHILPIEIVSGRYGPEEVKFVNNMKLTGQAEALSIADWKIGEGRVVEGTYYFKPMDKNLEMYTYEIGVERKAGFFLWRVVAPLLLIVFMSWMVFYIDPSHLEAQVGISATSVLTLVAFQFAVGILLPRISYLTRMDFFVLVTSIMVFAALVEGVATSGLAAAGRRETALRIDRYSRVIFPILYATFAILIFAL